MSPWLAAALALVSVLGGGGGLVALLTVRGQKHTIEATASEIEARADETMAGAVKVLLGSAAGQAKALDAELRECRAELLTVRRQADMLERKMARLIAMIHDPYMTLDRLRVTVPDATVERN